MSFNYNPQDKIDNGGKAEPGEYLFKVDQVTETTFRTGSEGWKVQLLVGAFPDKDIKVFVNFVQSPAALWKFEEFCASLGFDFNAPPTGGWRPEQFEGRTGKALFKKPEKFLEVDTFLPASANNGPDTRRKAAPVARPASRSADEPPPPGDDDCPM
jgi:hypothetical protein